MLPKGHVLLGLVFCALFWWIFPETAWYNLALIFFGAVVFIDLDHYSFVWNVIRFGPNKAFKIHEEQGKKTLAEIKRGIRGYEEFHVLHTVEAHMIVLALGLIFAPFLYLLYGMIFHSITDMIYLRYRGLLFRREFFLTNWIRRNLCK